MIGEKVNNWTKAVPQAITQIQEGTDDFVSGHVTKPETSKQTMIIRRTPSNRRTEESCLNLKLFFLFAVEFEEDKYLLE